MSYFPCSMRRGAGIERGLSLRPWPCDSWHSHPILSGNAKPSSLSLAGSLRRELLTLRLNFHQVNFMSCGMHNEGLSQPPGKNSGWQFPPTCGNSASKVWRFGAVQTHELGGRSGGR